MALTKLKYIVAVARELHCGKAAESCFVSQSTLSAAVKKLEEEFDVKLFERTANEIKVTPLGQEIVRQAQVVLEQAAEDKEIANLRDGCMWGWVWSDKQEIQPPCQQTSHR